MDGGGGGGGVNGLSRQRSALWRSLRNGDFEEDDVWDVLTEKSTTASKSFDDSNFFADSSISASGMIPRPNADSSTQIVPKSAPKSIPPRIERVSSRNPRKFSSESEDDDSSDAADSDGDEEVEEEEGLDNRFPPHELIATRLARAQISSFSVVEGVGRTLKGRDLSKVRNAILTRTGFLESF